MKKKVVSVILAMTMVASMAMGCGNSSDKTTSDNTTTTSDAAASTEASDAADATADAASGDLADKKVGVCIYQFADNFMTLFRGELENYLIEQGFSKENITIVDGANDQATQTNQIQNFITQGVDVLIINPVNSSSAETITDMVVEAGIPLVYINREPDASEEQRWADNNWDVTYVGCDARQSGTYQGEEILETANKGDINGDGTVSISDVVTLQKYLLQSGTLSTEGTANADMNADSKINGFDLAYLKRTLLTETPVSDGITIHLNDSGITVEGDTKGVTSVSGKVVTITASGNYTVDGSITDGQILIDIPDTTADADDVSLTLHQVTMTSSTGTPCLYTKSAAKTKLTLVGTSSFTDTAATANADTSGVLYSDSKFTVTKNSTGTLKVQSSMNIGIYEWRFCHRINRCGFHFRCRCY